MFWLIFSVAVLFLANYGEKRKSNEKYYIYARCCLVLVLSYAIGICSTSADRPQYIMLYENRLFDFGFGNVGDWLSLASIDVEIGFVLLCKLCKLIGLSAVGMLFVVSLITNSLVVSVFYRFRYPVIVFLLYIISLFFLQQTNLVRQMLAVSIGLYSLKYIEEKNFLSFVILVFVAFLFHKSSIILVLFAPLCLLKKIPPKTLKITLTVLWILSLLIYVGMVALDLSILGIFGETRYDTYLTGQNETLGVSKQQFDITYNIFVVFYLLFAKFDEKKAIYAIFFVLGCVVYTISLRIVPFYRMGFFFTPIFCAYLPTLMEENKLETSMSQSKQILFAVVILWYGRFLLSRMTEGYEQIGGTVGSIMDIFA